MVLYFYLSTVPALACLGDLYLYYGLCLTIIIIIIIIVIYPLL